MAEHFHHISVLPEETIAGLVTDPDGIYVDATLGGAGHSGRIVERLSSKGRLIGIDQDEDAIAAAKERLHARPEGPRIDVVRSNFSHLPSVLAALGVDRVGGVLFDLGVSSHQLDTAERGFSYMRDAPLDMRMDRRSKLSAYDVVNTYGEEELTRIFYAYGEERWSKRIAAFIVRAREERPVETTGALVDILLRAVPKGARQKGSHPAKRIFQAIRIEVNDELGILDASFRSAVDVLAPGGRIAIITFHSLEDRQAKTTLKELAQGCTCPKDIPVCICGKRPRIKLLGKAISPSAAEIERNARAKSAKLRIAEKL